MKEQYQNLSGNSGVFAFEISDDSIIVYFRNNWAYLYTYGSTGMSRVESMKALAVDGRGLGTYINQNVRTRFARKRRWY